MGLELPEWFLQGARQVGPLYEALALGVPLPVQGAIGLGLTACLVALTLGDFRRAFPAGGLRWALLLGMAWLVVYALLPMHLTGFDFDELFVLAKLSGPLDPEVWNRKPAFTWYDYFYRIPDLLGLDLQTEDRFRINGLFFWLYQLNLLVLLRRSVWPTASDRLSPGRAKWLAAAFLLNIGPFVLSLTVTKVMTAMSVILVSFQRIEDVRHSEMPGPQGEKILVLLALVHAVLQVLSSNQYAIVAILVIGHALFASVRSGLSLQTRGLLTIFLGFVIAGFVVRENPVIVGRLGDIGLVSWLLVLVLVSVIGWFVIRLARRKPIPGGRGTDDAMVLLFYSLGTVGPYLGALWMAFREPQGLVASMLCFVEAVDVARYAALWFPFAVALLLPLVLPRLRAGLFTGLAAAALVLWNLPFVTGFLLYPLYAPDSRIEKWTEHWNVECRIFGVDFHGEMLQALEEQMDEKAKETPPVFAYFPIWQPGDEPGGQPVRLDHGDHFLVMTLFPGQRFQSVCDGPIPPDAFVVLSSRTLLLVTPPLKVPWKSPDDTDDLVQLFNGDDLDLELLEHWCQDAGLAPRWPRD